MRNIDTIIYVHGIGSNGNGNTVTMLRNAYPDVNIIAPDIPMNPYYAIDMVRGIVREHMDDNILIIGTSLGGFYAMNIHGVPKIVINPAMFPSTDIPNAVGYGEHPYFGERLDGRTTYIVDEEFVDALADIENHFYNECLDWEYKYETYGIFGTEDNVVTHIDDFKKYYNENNMVIAKFGHRITADVFERVLITMIDRLDTDTATTLNCDIW